MSNFVNQWNVLKNGFGKDAVALIKEAGTGLDPAVRSEIVELVKYETGMSGALKVVDAAIEKKDAVAAMKALNKVHKVIEKTDGVFQPAAKNVMNAMMSADATVVDVVEQLAKCVATFNKEYKSFETSVAEAIEFLQESKKGVKIKVFSLEGDLKGAVKVFKAAITDKTGKALEKKYKVMDRVDEALKSMKLYSEAVGETNVKDAKKWLETYFGDSEDLDKYFKNLEGENPPLDADYLTAVEKLCKAMRTIKNQRGQDSLRDLNELLKDAT
jgi:hypothetical protein